MINQEHNGTSRYVRVEDVVYNQIEVPPIDFGDEWYEFDNIQKMRGKNQERFI